MAAVGDDIVIVLAVVFAAAIADTALGIGVILPGELAIVLASVTLSSSPGSLVVASLVAAAGAFVGDHVGYVVGRSVGPAVGRSRLIDRIGVDTWDRARSHVSKRFWPVVFGRLLPGVRTLFALAAGASSMPFSRFAGVSALGALAWGLMWVFGGAAIGRDFLALMDRALVPTLAGAVLILVTVVVVRRRRAAA